MKHQRRPSTRHATWHEERRQTVRVPVDQIVAYTINGSRPVIATVSELSNSSLRIVAGETIPVGTCMTIAFPSGAFMSQSGASRVHVFEGCVVHASSYGAQYRYGIDLFENEENIDDLRWTILQLSLRRSASRSKSTSGPRSA